MPHCCLDSLDFSEQSVFGRGWGGGCCLYFGTGAGTVLSCKSRKTLVRRRDPPVSLVLKRTLEVARFVWVLDFVNSVVNSVLE